MFINKYIFECGVRKTFLKQKKNIWQLIKNEKSDDFLNFKNFGYLQKAMYAAIFS